MQGITVIVNATSTKIREIAKMRRLVQMLVLSTLAVGAVGCGRMQDVKGYLADDQLVAAIQPGVDNRDSVMKTLGRPTMESEFDPNTWYYVSRRTEQFAFMSPKPTQHQVLIINFNDRGNVTKVEKMGMEQLAHVDPSNDKTPTRGKDVSIWQQLFGNIGRFSPAGAGGGPQ